MPHANIVPSKQNTISGKSFAWKPLPSTTDSKFETAVSASTNSHEPRKPPRIVFSCVAAKNGRYICIAEKSSTENMLDSANEVPLETAVPVLNDMDNKSGNGYPSGRLYLPMLI